MTNPATGERLPIYVADYVLMDYGTGAIMAVLGHDERDRVRRGFPLPVVQVIDADSHMVNSAQFDGLTRKRRRRESSTWLLELRARAPAVSFRLRDWSFSGSATGAAPFRSSTATSAASSRSGRGPSVLLPDMVNYLPKGSRRRRRTRSG